MGLFLRVLLLGVLASGCVSPRSAEVSSFKNRAASTGPLWISGEINDENLALPKLILSLSSDQNLTFHIDSPGGYVSSGLDFIDEMRAAQRRGVTVTCVVESAAYSMAAVILESCDIRLMKKQASIMFHTVSISGAEGGNQWTYERLVQAIAEYNKRLAIFVVGRLNISLECYEAHVKDKDWWLGYEEALDVGAIDGYIETLSGGAL